MAAVNSVIRNAILIIGLLAVLSISGKLVVAEAVVFRVSGFELLHLVGS